MITRAGFSPVNRNKGFCCASRFVTILVISLTKVASRDRSGAAQWHKLGCRSLKEANTFSGLLLPLTKIGRELPTPFTRPVLRARCCCSHAPGAHRGRTGVSLLQPLAAVGRCWLRADASGECLNLGSGNSAVASATPHRVS